MVALRDEGGVGVSRGALKSGSAIPLGFLKACAPTSREGSIPAGRRSSV